MGVRAPLDLRSGAGGGDLPAPKKYSVPESVSVEIGMLTHSNCAKIKNVHKDSSIERLHAQ